MTPTTPASSTVIGLLGRLIEDRTGLHWSADDAELLLEKLTVRSVDAGFESLLDYYYYVRYDAGGEAELDRLIDTLVINETYLFRELVALRTVVSHFVRPALEAGRRPKVWCAACSTGEEAYTLAMLLGQEQLLDRVDLVASDVSLKALERAKSGELGRRSLREVPSPALVSRWVREAPGRPPRVAPELTQAIDWRRINLRAKAEVAAVGPCDVILCRNVLIYFRDETAAEVVQSLAGQLVPNGALVVGVSESLLRLGTALECEQLEGAFFYRKAA